MRITYFFDVISPYSALSWTVLKRYKGLWGFDLVLEPVFLGGIMHATQNQPPALLHARGKFQEADLERNASLFDVPLLPVPRNFLSDVASKSILMQRLIIAAQLDQTLDFALVDDIVDSLTYEIHINPANRDDSNNLSIDRDLLTSALFRVSITPDVRERLIEAVNSDVVKQQLKINTSKAIDVGAFGSPTMLIDRCSSDRVESIMIFGSDRFEQIAWVIGKDWHGPRGKL